MSMSAQHTTQPSHSRGPASPTARVLAQARFETGSLMRNGEQLLVSIILPAIALVALARFTASSPELFGPSMPTGEHRMDAVMAGVLGLAVLSTAFTGQAISTGFDRRYGVLRLLGTTPLGRGGLLAAKGLAVLVIVAAQTLVLGAMGMAFGWTPHLGNLMLSLPFLVVGAWVFVAFALLFAGTLRAEAVLALANIIWVILVAVGGVLLPAPRLGGVEAVVPWLPSGALGQGMRAALSGSFDAPAFIVLVLWGILFTLAARAWFRWSD